MKALLRYREWLLAAIIAVIVTSVSLYAPAFGTLSNGVGVLNDTAFLFMMALGQIVVILTRGIDLSVAANLALTGMLVGLFNEVFPDLPPLVYVAVAVGIGAGLGAVNGALVALVGIPPIVVTLGTLAIFRGTIVIIGGGRQVNTSDMSASFIGFPKLELFGLSSVFWIALIVSALAWVFLGFTRAGRGLYAVGGNPVAARYCGISLVRQQFLAYLVSGTVAGLCGYLWVARYGVAYVEIATGYELTVIAAPSGPAASSFCPRRAAPQRAARRRGGCDGRAFVPARVGRPRNNCRPGAAPPIRAVVALGEHPGRPVWLGHRRQYPEIALFSRSLQSRRCDLQFLGKGDHGADHGAVDPDPRN